MSLTSQLPITFEPVTVEETDASCFVTSASSSVRLYQGDCLELLNNIEPGSIDVVVTSPPYNLGTDYSSYDDSLPREEYLCWISRWAEAVHRVLADDGSLFFNVGSKPSDPWVAMQAAASVMGCETVSQLHQEGRFFLQNTIHWIKSISIDPESIGNYVELVEVLSVGHYKPINSGRFLNDVHEYLFHFTKSGNVRLDRLAVGVPYQDKSNTTRWKSATRDKRCRGNNWFVPYETIQSRASERPHPATFPVQLVEWAIRLHGVEKTRCVLDPFLGLGTTAVACLSLGVSCIGFEIDPEYYQVALKRIKSSISAAV